MLLKNKNIQRNCKSFFLFGQIIKYMFINLFIFGNSFFFSIFILLSFYIVYIPLYIYGCIFCYFCFVHHYLLCVFFDDVLLFHLASWLFFWWIFFFCVWYLSTTLLDTLLMYLLEKSRFVSGFLFIYFVFFLSVLKRRWIRPKINIVHSVCVKTSSGKEATFSWRKNFLKQNIFW